MSTQVEVYFSDAFGVTLDELDELHFITPIGNVPSILEHG